MGLPKTTVPKLQGAQELVRWVLDATGTPDPAQTAPSWAAPPGTAAALQCTLGCNRTLYCSPTSLVIAVC